MNFYWVHLKITGIVYHTLTGSPIALRPGEKSGSILISRTASWSSSLLIERATLTLPPAPNPRCTAKTKRG